MAVKLKTTDPIWWGLFSAGGTLAAFLLPVHVLVTGLGISRDHRVSKDDDSAGEPCIEDLSFFPHWPAAFSLGPSVSICIDGFGPAKSESSHSRPLLRRCLGGDSSGSSPAVLLPLMKFNPDYA